MAYTEGLPSSFKFNNKETVDTIFSKILIDLLFKDNTFVPGETFTDEYNERAGQIYIRQLGKTTVEHTTTTNAGGLDLGNGTEAEDKLRLIQKTNVISANEKCYEAVSELRASGKSVDKVKVVVESFKEQCQIKWMSYLLGTPAEANAVGVGGATRTADTTKDETFADLIASLLATREQIIVNGGRPDVLLVSPEMETLFLKNAYTPGNAFVPNSNEEIVKTGIIGRLFNMNVKTTNLIGSGTPLTGSVSANTGNAYNCEYIMYDHRTFGICADIYGPRLEDSEFFFGSKAQIQAVCGGGVANPALAYCKIVSD